MAALLIRILLFRVLHFGVPPYFRKMPIFLDSQSPPMRAARRGRSRGRATARPRPSPPSEGSSSEEAWEARLHRGLGFRVWGLGFRWEHLLEKTWNNSVEPGARGQFKIARAALRMRCVTRPSDCACSTWSYEALGCIVLYPDRILADYSAITPTVGTARRHHH